MDNRHALIVDCRVTQAVGTGERDAAKAMAAELPGAHKKTLDADKNYDTKGMVAELRRIGVTPHVAQNTNRPGGSAIDGRTTRHEGYAQSINARRGIEKVFGWIKQWGGLRQFKLRGLDNVSAVFGLHVIAYNLIRLNNILKPAFAAIGQWLKDLTGGWGNLKRGADAFLKILSDIGKMMSNLKVPSWVTSGAQAAGSWLGGLLPGHASGVRNCAGGWSVVGERGPELVNLPRGSDVLSTRASSRMLARSSEGGATITIAPVFSGVVIDNEERLRQVSTQIRHETERALARAFGTAVDSLILGRGPL
jgi:hypothetical protein